MHFKIYTLFQNFIMQITLISGFFIITCFLLLILIKETKTWNIRPQEKFSILIFSNWIGVLPVYPKFCIGADDSYSQASKYFDQTSGSKVTSFSFLLFISLVCKICNACMGKLIVTSPFVIFCVWWIKKPICKICKRN